MSTWKGQEIMATRAIVVQIFTEIEIHRAMQPAFKVNLLLKLQSVFGFDLKVA